MITIHQNPTRVVAGFPTTNISFAATPTVGRYVIVIASIGHTFGTDWTGVSVTDNQGNTYSQALAFGQSNGCLIAWAPINTASGTFTVTVTVTGGSADAGSGVNLLEVSGLNGSNLIDLQIELENQTSFATTFNVTTPVIDTAEELVVAMGAPRTSGTWSATGVPSGYTQLFQRNDGGDGGGIACYRITSVAAAQSINYTAGPDGGDPSMMILSFRGLSGGASKQTMHYKRLRA